MKILYKLICKLRGKEFDEFWYDLKAANKRMKKQLIKDVGKKTFEKYMVYQEERVKKEAEKMRGQTVHIPLDYRGRK